MNKMKKTTYQAVRKCPRSNKKVIERDKIDTPNTQIHDRSL